MHFLTHSLVTPMRIKNIMQGADQLGNNTITQGEAGGY
jgi:hypothetical protein